MFESIEKLIDFGYDIIIAKVRYGSGFYIAFDSDDLNYKPFAELLEGIGGFDDVAIAYMHALEEIESKYPDYPVVLAKSLEEGFKRIDEKIENWLRNYKYHEQSEILNDIEVIVKELSKHWV